MMLAQEYIRGDANRLSQHWGISSAALRQYTAKASARIKQGLSDDEIKEWAEDILTEIAEGRDPHGKVAAVKLLLETRGLGPTRKAEITHKREMPEEEVNRILLEAGWTPKEIQTKVELLEATKDWPPR